MRNKLWFLLALGFLTFGMNMAFAAGDRTAQPPQSRSQQSTMGTIDNITDDMITLKTDDGKMQSYTVNQAQREEFKNLKQGDRIDLMINQQNQIVGVNKQNQSNRDQSSPNRFNSNPNGNSNLNSNPDTNPNSNPSVSPNPNTSPSPNPNPGPGGLTPGPAPNR